MIKFPVIKHIPGFPEATKPIFEFKAPRDISKFERPNTVKKPIKH
jgi:hypothetical protein